MREVEIKAKINNASELEAKLLEMGAIFERELQQNDRVFVFQNPQLGTKAQRVRLREQEGKYIVTVKKMLTNALDNTEREVDVSDPGQFADMLELMDYKELFQVKKHRKFFKYSDMTVCLDKVDKLGEFIEIEKLIADEDETNVQADHRKLLTELGIPDGNIIMHGYSRMMADFLKVAL